MRGMHVACRGEGRGAYRGLVGKSDGKSTIGRRRFRWEKSTKIYLNKYERRRNKLICISIGKKEWFCKLGR
jgi:hypothetical protein